MVEAKLVAINDAQRLPRIFWRKLPAVQILEGADGVRPVMLGLGKSTLTVIANPGTYQVRPATAWRLPP